VVAHPAFGLPGPVTIRLTPLGSFTFPLRNRLMMLL
jgi:hypothetical protein